MLSLVISALLLSCGTLTAAQHGIITGGSKRCLNDSDLTRWGRRVGRGAFNRLEGTKAPNSSPTNPNRRAIRVMNALQRSLQTQEDTSRLVSCGWENGEYISVQNCASSPLSESPACQASKGGYVAVISNPERSAEGESFWHFYDFVPGESLENMSVQFLGNNSISFDPRINADWFRAQRALIRTEGCGNIGWLGISKPFFGTPLPVAQYAFPLVDDAKDSKGLCGDFLGACASGVTLTSEFVAGGEDCRFIEIDIIDPINGRA